MRTLPQSFEIWLVERKKRDAARAQADVVQRTDVLERANAAIFARECEVAGLPPDSAVSPALLASSMVENRVTRYAGIPPTRRVTRETSEAAE